MFIYLSVKLEHQSLQESSVLCVSDKAIASKLIVVNRAL